jgi:hypothetical protein
VIEKLTDLPAGVLGFCASGKITSDEYRQMMEPIYAALERGERLNIYFELADDFDGLDLGALWQDMQAAGSVVSRGPGDLRCARVRRQRRELGNAAGNLVAETRNDHPKLHASSWRVAFDTWSMGHIWRERPLGEGG